MGKIYIIEAFFNFFNFIHALSEYQFHFYEKSGPEDYFLYFGVQGQGLSANVTTNLPVSMHSITTTNEPSGGSHTAMGMAGEGAMGYVPVRQHWFYLRPEETYWIPFSLMDSQALETAFLQAQDTSLQVQCSRVSYRIFFYRKGWVGIESGLSLT